MARCLCSRRRESLDNPFDAYEVEVDDSLLVWQHSTNTRLTDVEVLELRTPLLVKQFSIREGSGGAGEFEGGASLPLIPIVWNLR